MLAWTPDRNGREGLRLAEVPSPQPSPDQVVVAVEAYSVNRGETFLLEAPPLGWRPGKDVAGRVVRGAADGTGPAPGQRVVAHPPAGGWAQEVAVAVRDVAELPEQVSTASAAALPLAGLTALRLLRATGSVAGRRVLLTGASGGVGHYFVELAAAHGALITAVAHDRHRGARLLDLGATEVVGSVDEAGGPFDIVIESVGGAAFSAAWSRLSDRGLFLWMGQASRTPAVLDFLDWRGGASGTLRKFSYVDSDVSVGDDLATLVRLVRRDRLHPEIASVRDWKHTPDTLRALLARQVRGNAVLEVTA